MGVLLLFVDGLGLGEDDPGRNPVARARLRRLRLLRDCPAPDPAATLIPTDACLGVAGLPQSATGQTSILAGVKTSAVINVGTATIAAFIGAGGYGERIASGLALNDHTTLLAGALPAAALALLVQGLFELAEWRFGWMAKLRRR